MLEIGGKPEPLRLLLTEGEPFQYEIKLEDPEDIFGAVAPRLLFEGGQVWTSYLVDQQLALFSVSAADVSATVLSLGDSRGVSLMYGTQTWAKGRVEVL